MTTFAARPHRTHDHRSQIVRASSLLAAVTACVAIVAALPVDGADPSPPIVRIEEDWEVVIGVPDPDTDSPQITTVISPLDDLDASTYAIFELNHSTSFGYQSGGMQLQAWVGDLMVDHRNYPGEAVFATAEETVRFTLSMAVADGYLQFAVKNGSSTTWGSFGNLGYFKCTVSTTATDLSGYNALTSTENSRVGFASHRVKKFVRKEIRYYTAAGLAATDSNPVVVLEHNPSEGN